MVDWLTVRCKRQSEKRSEARLRDHGFTTYLPKCKRDRSKNNADTVALFPGYFFIFSNRIVLADRERGWKIYQVITDPIPDEAIDELKGREVDGVIELPKREPFTAGQPVQVLSSGAWFGQRGLYQGMTADERIAVLFTVLGRDYVRDFHPRDVAGLAIA